MYLIDPHPIIWFLIIILIITLHLIIKSIRNIKFPLFEQIINSLWLIYLTMLIKVTFFPISTSPIGSHPFSDKHNFIPIASIIDLLQHNYYIVPYENILGSTVLFIPFGFFVPLLYRKSRSIKKTVLIGLFLSFFIELFQLVILNNTKRADIDDVILNCLGTVIGFLIFKSIPKLNETYIKSETLR